MTAKRTKRQDMEATGVFTITGHRRHAFRTGERAYSLVEMMVALIVVGVLISMGVPRFQVSLEQARANAAGANLQAIWSAQRLFWLQNRIYASGLDTLRDANLIDQSLYPKTPPTTPPSYTYTMELTESGFTATATRNGSSSWSGSWTIDQNGLTGGSILENGQATHIVLGFQ
jgi:prepilin-type N-terminal cleavage/methylation domain-containing protein